MSPSLVKGNDSGLTDGLDPMIFACGRRWATVSVTSPILKIGEHKRF